jgi:signal transduction histidine kinase
MIALHDIQPKTIEDHRLAAIAQVAAGLSHESRGALQRIGASAEMLEIELEGNPAALQHVARIYQSQRHLCHLLDDLRSFAVPLTLDRTIFRISEAWREAWELLLPQRRGRLAEVREHLCSENLLIEADRFRLVQTFRTLLDNSFAACVDPVQIEFTCEEVSLKTECALRVSVRDCGPGLSSEQRDRVFEPFYTTKPTGTGLGMAIAKRIVEAHGGTIEIGDNLPPGAEIIVTLPHQT